MPKFVISGINYLLIINVGQFHLVSNSFICDILKHQNFYCESLLWVFAQWRTVNKDVIKNGHPRLKKTQTNRKSKENTGKKFVQSNLPKVPNYVRNTVVSDRSRTALPKPQKRIESSDMNSPLGTPPGTTGILGKVKSIHETVWHTRIHGKKDWK